MKIPCLLGQLHHHSLVEELVATTNVFTHPLENQHNIYIMRYCSRCDSVKGHLVRAEFVNKLIRNGIKPTKFSWALKQIKELYLSTAGLDHEFTS